ncbi:MAG: methionine adenosyltransferase [Patescibacteria group bacterium]
MENLRFGNAYFDPGYADLEIVERKGLGHPDTLADALAELISIKYSKYCQEKFQAIPHHNIDKLYIGAGLFQSNYGFCRRVVPVTININGRMSASFGDEKIPLESLQRDSIIGYLRSILPNLQESDFIINHNATQNSRLPHWFAPRDINDLPEYAHRSAGDNAVCVFSWPLTTTEKLVSDVEGYFWKKDGRFPEPRFRFLGQDIKVMAIRQGKHINISVRVPVITTQIKDHDEYLGIVQSVAQELNQFISSLLSADYSFDLEVNAHRPYMLGIGSCIECGEEGLVGRGNSNSGLISIFRPHSVEAPSGKNPVYHTGRVLNYLTMKLSKAIYDQLGTKNTVLAVTKNGGSLVPPYLLSIDTDQIIDEMVVKEIVQKNFMEVDYLNELLNQRRIA